MRGRHPHGFARAGGRAVAAALAKKNCEEKKKVDLLLLNQIVGRIDDLVEWWQTEKDQRTGGPIWALRDLAAEVRAGETDR